MVFSTNSNKWRKIVLKERESKMKKRLVLVVDMVNGFCKEGVMHDTRIMDIVPAIINTLNTVESNHRLFIADTHKKDAVEFTSFPPHCIEDTSEADIIDELLPFIGHVDPCTSIVSKNSTNAAWTLPLRSLAYHYDEFIIVGCCTDICVLQLALSLKTYLNQNNHNKAVIVPQDTVATYNIPDIHDAKEYQEFALKLMHNAGIDTPATL